MNFKFPSPLPATVFFVYTAVFSFPAFAYLDPGTGSMLLQIMLGVLIGAGAAVRVYWDKIKTFFSGDKTPPPEENT